MLVPRVEELALGIVANRNDEPRMAAGAGGRRGWTQSMARSGGALDHAPAASQHGRASDILPACTGQPVACHIRLPQQQQGSLTSHELAQHVGGGLPGAERADLPVGGSMHDGIQQDVIIEKAHGLDAARRKCTG